MTSGGKLEPVLRGIEEGFAKANPRSIDAALEVVARSAEAVGLEPGVVVSSTKASVIIENQGGVMTQILANGQAIGTRGADVLLRLIPSK